MKTYRKLTWVIYPSYLFIIIATLLTISLYTSTTLKRFSLQKTEQELRAYAYVFRMLLGNMIPVEQLQDGAVSSLLSLSEQEQSEKNLYAEVDSLCKTVGKQLAIRMTVVFVSGRVIGDSEEDPDKMDNHANRPEIRTALSEQIGTSMRYSYTLEKDMMYVAIPFRASEEIIGVVRASTAIAAINQAVAVMYKEIMLGGIVVACLAAIISYVMSRRITRPLQEIKHGAMRFASGDLNHRLYISPGSQEICMLAEAMNRMASQLAERIDTITQQRTELEAMLSSMVEAVIVVDQEERIVRSNQAAGRLFRFNVETSKNRSIQEVIRNADIQRFVKKTLESHIPLEDVIVLNSTIEQFLRAHGTLLRSTTNQTTGALIVFHNITRLKQLENIRREFVANVSHELKTPITSIKGFVETLRDGAIDDAENVPRFLDIISRNANRLNAIIEDLLLLSKIEQGEEADQIVLTKESLKNVLSMAITVCESPAQEKQIVLQLDCAPHIKAKVNPDLFEQAVVNLLDNAIKYSDPQSTINIKAERRGNQVIISVQDFGCGISEEHLPRLFERFYRVDKARSRQLGGTGLGLAIVKHIVNAHRGTITVESTPGQGSIFSISLPG